MPAGRQAGIVVMMITGDHQVTASAIAAELGLHGRAVSGADIDRMDEARLAAAIDEVAVFAPVTPSHKVKIARAQQARRAAAGLGALTTPEIRTHCPCAP